MALPIFIPHVAADGVDGQTLHLCAAIAIAQGGRKVSIAKGCL